MLASSLEHQIRKSSHGKAASEHPCWLYHVVFIKRTNHLDRRERRSEIADRCTRMRVGKAKSCGFQKPDRLKGVCLPFYLLVSLACSLSSSMQGSSFNFLPAFVRPRRKEEKAFHLWHSICYENRSTARYIAHMSESFFFYLAVCFTYFTFGTPFKVGLWAGNGW